VETVKIAMAYAGKQKYLFPSSIHSHRPITDNALNRRIAASPGSRASMCLMVGEPASAPS
jgi:hypothetical protein